VVIRLLPWLIEKVIIKIHPRIISWNKERENESEIFSGNTGCW
jgi:hypothetical protein